MGKDDAQLFKERRDRLDKEQEEQWVKSLEERRMMEEGQASAYLIREGDSQYGPLEKKQLLFTVPEHPRPKFLSKTSLLQQLLLKESANHDYISEDNQFIFEEIMKNEIIREQFDRIQEMYGSEAYELNKLSLLNFIKQGKHNFTYSVKYYGIDDGQIGILSRKVPYDEFLKRQAKTNRLPRISPALIPKSDYEYVEVEYSEDESYMEEVEASSDEEIPLPKATKPRPDLDILQGSVGGREFDGVKKDSNPLDTEVAVEQSIVQPIVAKRMKMIKKKRRVKRKKIIKKLKPQVDESMDDASSQGGLMSFQLQPQSEGNTLEMTNFPQPVEQPKMLNKNRSQTHINKVRVPNQEEAYEDPQQEIQNLQDLINQETPYMINFRELFKKCELQNLKEFKKPEPEKYNHHIVHQYSLPKGLQSLKRQNVLSEAERFDKERYSKRNVQLHMIDKEYQKMNLGGQSYGLKGSKVKPIYFPFNHTTSLSNSQSQSMLFQSQQQKDEVQQQIQARPLKPIVIKNKLQELPTRNAPIDKILINDAQQNKFAQISLETIQPLTSQPTQVHEDRLASSPQTDQPGTLRRKPSHDISKDAFSEDTSTHNNNNHAIMQMYNINIANKHPFGLQSNDVSHINKGSMNFAVHNGNSIHLFDKNISQQSSLMNLQSTHSLFKQQQVTKKNNQIIKNLARVKKAEPNENFDLAQVGVFNKAEQVRAKGMQRNASTGSHMQYGFQISNQMKAAYLMDTRKILEKSKQKKEDGESSGEEDQIIFENQQKDRGVQLPLIKNASQPSLPSLNNNSDREIYLRFLKFKTDQNQDQLIKKL